VLRLLKHLPYSVTRFVDEAVLTHCQDVAVDHFGLRVMKALLANRKQSEITRLLKKVCRLTMKLVEDQYGNYVIQEVLDVGSVQIRSAIYMKMEGKYTRLSKQKFSSNVVERCLRLAYPEWRATMLAELTHNSGICDLLKDRYGNYVLQTALSVSSVQQVHMIADAVTPHLESLRDNVRLKWTKILHQATMRM
jgi:hypothetical protein